MIGTDMSLGLLACALDSPGLQLLRAPSAGRWRGPLGEASTLTVSPGAPHRAVRLQVLRRVLDLQANGRWALAVRGDNTSGLVGPLNNLVDRVLDLRACLATWPHAVLLRRLFLWVDGERVDQLVRSRFPGAARDLPLDPAPLLPFDLAALVRDIAPPLDAAGALDVALTLHRYLLRNQSRMPLGLPYDPAGSTPLSQVSTLSMEDGGAGASRPFNDGIWAPGAQRASTSAGELHSHLAPPTDAALLDTASTVDPSPQEAAVSFPSQVAALPSASTTAQSITHHDEWDYNQRAYRKRWVAVHERRVEGSDLKFRSDVLARFPSLARQIRHQLARVSADAARRQRRLQDGESVDMDAAMGAFVDRLAGQLFADDRLYQARPRQDRDLCVALLLDVSGSTSYFLSDVKRSAQAAPDRETFEPDDLLWQQSAGSMSAPPSQRRRVIDVVKDAAVLVCEALQALGDRHAVFAFSGQGRQKVEFDVVKHFDQVGSAQTAAAIATLQPKGATRMGAALRHTLQFLHAESARRRMLIVMSDGYPQDDDYGPDPKDLQYGLSDTAHALAEAERTGIVTFNISVDAAANDYLRRICPKNRYLVIEDADALPLKVFALLRRMSASRA